MQATGAAVAVKQPGIIEDVKEWFRTQSKWWAGSLLAHVVALAPLYFLVIEPPKKQDDAALFEVESMNTAAPEAPLTKFEVGETSIEPTVLNTETLTMADAPTIEQSAQMNDNSSTFEAAGGGSIAAANTPSLGGLGGFDFKAVGPGAAVKGAGGVGLGVGTSGKAGAGGGGEGFAGRGSGSRKAQVGSGGGSKQTERAVGGGINWLVRHQNPDGSWSLNNFHTRCKNTVCKGTGSHKSDTAATAFALLPFLAAGQTHKTGAHVKTVQNGLNWLVKTQDPSGNFAKGEPLYAHGLATIVVCEAYGMSKDPILGRSASSALKYIENAQEKGGGWDYQPKSAGGWDTSVSGWQLMALKSGQMAGLQVSPTVLDNAKKWLAAAGAGTNKGLFRYRETAGPSQTMTAVGLLCSQYLGLFKRDDPALKEGFTYLMANLPNKNNRNCYYWYYATQVMHNMPGPDWDIWNRQMRRTLIETQVTKGGCDEGSWDPDKPIKDAWGEAGGRLMVTAIGVLTLEVYYRYLPLYQLNTDEGQLAMTLAKPMEKKESKPEASKPAPDAKPAKPVEKPAEKPKTEKPAEKPAKK